MSLRGVGCGVRLFCSRGSLTPVATPDVFFEEGTGYVEADLNPCFEGCGLGATCGNRGQRTRLQRRLGRRVVVSYPDFL